MQNRQTLCCLFEWKDVFKHLTCFKFELQNCKRVRQSPWKNLLSTDWNAPMTLCSIFWTDCRTKVHKLQRNKQITLEAQELDVFCLFVLSLTRILLPVDEAHCCDTSRSLWLMIGWHSTATSSEQGCNPTLVKWLLYKSDMLIHLLVPCDSCVMHTEYWILTHRENWLCVMKLYRETRHRLTIPQPKNLATCTLTRTLNTWVKNDE